MNYASVKNLNRSLISRPAAILAGLMFLAGSLPARAGDDTLHAYEDDIGVLVDVKANDGPLASFDPGCGGGATTKLWSLWSYGAPDPNLNPALGTRLGDCTGLFGYGLKLNRSGTDSFGYVNISDSFDAAGDPLVVDLGPNVIYITISPRADAPNLLVSDTGGNEDTIIPLPISASLNDLDGSETLTVIVSGVPAGSTMSRGVETPPGSGTYVIAAGDLPAATIQPPLNDDSSFALGVTARATEATFVVPNVVNYPAPDFSFIEADNGPLTINVTVTPVNDAPTANDDVYGVAEGGIVSGTAGIAGSGVLNNDSDPDGDGLTVSLKSSPAFAAAFSLNGDGSFSYTHNGTENFTDAFTYNISDGFLSSAIVTVTINITPVNDNVPSAVDDAYGLIEGASVSGTAGLAGTGVLGNDSDADLPGDSLTVVPGSGPSFASSFTLSGDGSFSYTHDNSENFTDSFTYTINDGLNTSAPATVTLTITPVNDNAPSAVDDAYGVAEGGTVSGTGTLAGTGVLGNDSDADLPPNPLTVTIGSSPTNAALFNLNPNGSFSYTHDGSEVLSDSFTYTVNDGLFTSPAATVTITVTPVNDNAPVAVDDAYSLDEGAVLLGTAGLAGTGVLGNDSDADAPGDTLTALQVTSPAFGALTLNGNGSFSYTHNGSENFADSFTYRINDGVNLSSDATVTITINPINDNTPATVADVYGTTEGGSVSGTAGLAGTGVLGNDSDADLPPDSLVVSLSAGPANAAAFVLNADGSFNYTHDDSETASDSFTYTVFDGANTSAVTTVTINITPVNDNSPVANDDAFVVLEGALLSVVGGDRVIVNDTDADLPADPLSATLITPPLYHQGGVFNLNSNGRFDYQHDGSENHLDTFTYQVSDGLNNSNIATVTITITPTNDNTPVAVDDAYAVDEGATVTGTAGLAGTGVFGNDSDADAPGDTLTALQVSPPTYGALTLNGDGSFSYTHNGTENFSDTFTYRISDGVNLSADATVTITINPVNDNTTAVVDDAYGPVAEGGTLSVLAASGVLANDSDADLPANILAAGLVSGPANAAAFSLNADGSFSYTHDDSEILTDSFTYNVFDGVNTSATATVTMTISPVNDNAPVANDDAYSLSEAATINHTAGLAGTGVLGNDSDADEPGDVLTVALTAGPTRAASFTLNANGSFSYVHDGSDPNAYIPANIDTFTYSLSDGVNPLATATVTLTISEVNDNWPIGVDDAYPTVPGTLLEGGILNVPASGVLGNDTDADASPLITELVSSPVYGALILNADGSFDYTHNDTENFSDSFTYKAVESPGGNKSAVTTVTLTITPVNDNTPVGTDDAGTVGEGAILSATTVLANDTDADLPGDTLTVSAANGGGIGVPVATTNGSVTMQSNGTYAYTHDGSENLSDSFTYTIFDTVNTSAPVTVVITVTPDNDQTPIVVDDTYGVAEGGVLSGTAGLAGTGVLGNDSDADAPGDTLTVAKITGTTFGALVLNADGSFTYSHNGSENFSDSFTYNVFDGVNTSATATVTINITPVNDNTTVTVDDAYALNEGASVSGTGTLAGTGVLGNDSDADLPGDTLNVSVVSSPANAAAFVLGTDGSFTYTHDDSEVFTDSFTYTVNDGVNTSAAATVTFTITAVNDNTPVGTADVGSVDENGTLNATTVLVNDTDSDLPGDTLTVSAVNGGGIGVPVATTNGTVTMQSDGTYSYTHGGSELFVDSFTYTIFDGVNTSAPVTVSITINPVNDNTTVVVNDAYGLNEGATLTGTAGLAGTGVLGNDSDADLPGDTLTVILGSSPTRAAAFSLGADGSFSYTHDDSENFTDSFTYTVNDGTNVSATATVTITITPVNDNTTVTVNDAYALSEGGSVSGTGGLSGTGVLGNDSDADLPGDTLTVSVATPPANAASFSLGTDGSFSYTHDDSEIFTDTFTYTVNDGTNTSAAATVTLTITPVNDNTPLGVADTGSLAEGATLVAASVLANDTDADLPANTLSVAEVNGSAANVGSAIALSNGTVTVLADGTYTYVHNNTESFTDNFTYKIFDGLNTSTTVTVTLTINPVNDNTTNVVNDAYGVLEGATVTGTGGLAGTGVLGNDSDADLPGDTLTVSVVSAPSYSSGFTMNSDGSFSYTHDDTENLSDSFTYNVNDGTNTSATATVTITITPVNDETPVANADSYAVNENATLIGSTVLVNDTDADAPGDTLTAALASAPSVAGSFVFNANGTFTYVHDGSEIFTDSFTYTVNDGVNTSAPGTVSLFISPTNDNTPVTVDDSYATLEGGTVTGTSGLAGSGVLGNDSDADLPGDSLRATVVSAPSYGSVTLNLDGSFSYTHDDSENFLDSFTYEVFDGVNTSAPATVTITITPQNDNAPLAFADSYALLEGGTVSGTAGQSGSGVLGNDTDADLPPNTLSVSLVAAPSYATLFTLNADGSFTYQHDDSENLADTFTYRISDGVNLSNIGTVSLSLTGVNDNSPVGGADALSVDELDSVTFDVLANDTDADLPGDSIVVTEVMGSAANVGVTLNFGSGAGTFMIAANGQLTVIMTSDTTVEVFSENLDYSISDGVFTVSAIPIVLTIDPLNDNVPVAEGMTDETVDEDAGNTLKDLIPSFSDRDIDADGFLDASTVGDNDGLTFSAVTSNATLVNLSISGSTLTLDYQDNQHGTSTITVTAVDAFGQSASDSFLLTVSSVNDPVSYIGSYTNLSMIEDDPPFTIDLANSFTDIDLTDGDASDEQLTYILTITEVPGDFVRTGLLDIALADIAGFGAGDEYLLETTDPTITLPLVADASGTITIQVTARDLGRPPEAPADPDYKTDSATFTVTITKVDDDVPTAVDDGSAGTPFVTIDEDSDPVDIFVMVNDIHGDYPARVTSAGQSVVIGADTQFFRSTTRQADPLNTGDLATVANGEVACLNCGAMSADSTISGTGLPVDVVRYKPSLNYHGIDSFDYCIQDNVGTEESCATVYVEVSAQNDPPDTSSTIVYTMNQEETLTADVAGGLRSQVSDADNTNIDGFGCNPLDPACTPSGDTLYFRFVSATTDNGELLPPFLTDGSFTYRPDASFSGTDFFLFDVCDQPFATAGASNCQLNVVANIVVEPVAAAATGSSDEAVEFDYQLSQGPLELPVGSEANVLIMLDDSTSMAWDIMTTDLNGIFYYGTGDAVNWILEASRGGGNETLAPSEEAAPGHGLWRLRNSEYNKVYYDPRTNYTPWVGVDPDGIEFRDSIPNNARNNPMISNGSNVATNLTVVTSYTGKAPSTTETCGQICVDWAYSNKKGDYCRTFEDSCSNNTGFQNVSVTNYWIPRYYTWNDLDSDGVLDAAPSPATDPATSEGALVEIRALDGDGNPATYAKGPARTDCTTNVDSCTYTEELQNFANWFSYARTRNLATKWALGQTIGGVENLRIGYSLLNDATQRAGLVSVNESPLTGHKAFLLDQIYNTGAYGGTPLRTASELAGQHFECASGDNFGARISNTPGASSCPALPAPEGNCQMSFFLLFTDGAWNDNFNTAAVQDEDGDNNTVWDGGVFAGAGEKTLGDIAMYYYERDLQPLLDDEVPTTAIDLAYAPESAFGASTDTMHQHMTFYAVGFGVTGTVAVEDVPTDYTQSFTWPEPVLADTKIDDLMHATVNGRGRYLDAGNPAELVVALKEAFEDFQAGSGAASAVSFNSQEVQEDTLIFRAFYNTKINTGDLIAQELTEAGLVATPVWSAAARLDLKTFDTRNIITHDRVNNLGIPFRATSLNTEQRALFISDPSADVSVQNAEVLDRVNYLRGDPSNERPLGNLRERPDEVGRLGDIVHSTPVFVGFPDRLNRDASPYPQTDLYTSFSATHTLRKKMIYTNANDGMLHGIEADDGDEAFAYVPDNLMTADYSRKITDLLSFEYSHKYLVDNTNAVNDVYLDADGDGDKEWATVLVGSHRAGSKAYFALDVTDPTKFTEANANDVTMWEFTDEDDTYPTNAAGNPITNADGTQKMDLQSTPKPVKDLGYTFSVPTLAMSNLVDTDGENIWVAMFGNGFNSTAGIAKLFVLFLGGGVDNLWCHPDMVYNNSLTPAALPSACVGKQEFVKLNTTFGVPASGPLAGFPNGLGTPRGIDVDANGTLDYAFAGDTLGNFYRFNLTSANFADWTVTKLFEARYIDPLTSAEKIQPIMTQPIAIEHPTEDEGYIIIFATGSYITVPDGSNRDVQSIYGLWDRLGPVVITKADLVEQNYANRLDATFGNVRVLSNNSVDYSLAGDAKRGWFIDLDPPAAGGTQDTDPPEFPGERAIRNIQLRGGVTFVNSVIPRSNTSCTSTAGGFALAFCPGTGGTTCLGNRGIFDLNNDGMFDAGDETGGETVAATRFEDAIPTDSAFIGESRITQLSDQSLDATFTNTAAGSNTGRLSWKQVPTVE